METAAADRIEDDVGTAPARDPLHFVGDVGVAVVDRVLDAEAAQRVVFVRRRRPDDRCAPQPGELRRRDADAAASVVDEHGFAGGQRGHPVERQRCGQIGDRDCRGLGVAEPIGKPVDLRRRHRHHVGIAAEARQRDDAIAGVHGGDPRADRVDEPGHLVADDHRRLRRVGVDADTGEEVGEIDAGRADADPDLALRGRRIGVFAQLEHVGVPVPRDDRLAHRREFTGNARASDRSGQMWPHVAIIVPIWRRQAFAN